MTKIFFTKQSNTAFVLEVKGHAGYAECGHDIVCSAISILAQTLIAHVDNVAEDFEARVDAGDAWIWAKGKEAVASASTILTGFKLLADNFPDYVQIEIKGCP